MRTERESLRPASAGTGRALTSHIFGAGGSGPSVYIQAGLHADESPGMLVAQHLIPRLAAAEAAGRLRGEVRLVPVANPIGLAQWAFQRPQGRFEAGGLRNFNRGFVALAERAGDDLEGRLGADRDENRRLIRQAFRAALADARAAARTEAEEAKAVLLGWSCGADIVLDLHCDHVAVLHFYASPARPDLTAALARATGARLALIETVSGGDAFDEANSAPWVALARRFGPSVPAPPFAVTLEYRGQFDVSDALAADDAARLMAFLAGAGVVEADPAGAPPTPATAFDLLPLGGAAELHAPVGGLVIWERPVGAEVAAGERVAQVIDPESGARFPVTAPVAGLLFRQELWRAVPRGLSLGHVAGTAVLRAGMLLSD